MSRNQEGLELDSVEHYLKDGDYNEGGDASSNKPRRRSIPAATVPGTSLYDEEKATIDNHKSDYDHTTFDLLMKSPPDWKLAEKHGRACRVYDRMKVDYYRFTKTGDRCECC